MPTLIKIRRIIYTLITPCGRTEKTQPESRKLGVGGVGPALLLTQRVALGTSLPALGLSFLFCEMVGREESH